METSRRGRALIFALALLGGCAPTPGPAPAVGQGRQAVIDGTADPGDPAVVMFAMVHFLNGSPDRLWTCSGTLIAPRTVLTAAHCVADTLGPDGKPDPAYQSSILFTSTALTFDAQGEVTEICPPGCRAVKVIQQVMHPGYDASKFGVNDVALLELEAPVLDIKPLEPNPTPLSADDVGRPARHIGFGMSVPGNGPSSGVKRQGTLPLSSVQPALIELDGTAGQNCEGDSGGPALLVTQGSHVERVAGVVSYGDAACQTYGMDMRVDAFLDFIHGTMAGWEPAPTCAADGLCVRSGCASPDPDCAAQGAACTSDAQCASGACLPGAGGLATCGDPGATTPDPTPAPTPDPTPAAPPPSDPPSTHKVTAARAAGCSSTGEPAGLLASGAALLWLALRRGRRARA